MLLQDTAVLEYERRLSALKSAARMQRTLERKEQVLEQRRTAILAAEAAAEFRMQQKEEVRNKTGRHTHCNSTAAFSDTMVALALPSGTPGVSGPDTTGPSAVPQSHAGALPSGRALFVPCNDLVSLCLCAAAPAAMCVQLRLLQEAIKREEDYLAEERRREIQARAEADEEAKCAYYLAKQEERELRLQQVSGSH